MSWKDFPKVELHMHLEGAAPPAFVRGLAQEKSIDLTGVFDERGNYTFRDFPHFLQVYEAATQVLKTPDDYRRLTLAVLEQCAENGVVYAESFLSPEFCGGRDVTAWKEYLHAMQEAADAAETQMGITLRGIVTCIRHFGPDKAKQTAICAAETAGDWITGFGMGGNEGMGRQGDFAWAFDCAREAGLRLTTHAGEFAGPASVRQAVEDLRVERIGHGVRAIEDPALVDILAEREIVLEVCPGSNVVLGLYPGIGAHPIAKLRDAGVKVTVSTDDPPFFNTTMTREYEALERAFGWGAEDFAELNRVAIEAAFCDDDTRNRIKERLERA
ncbi:adenosine deaminase [Thalassovita aquimarina]|uniref:Adenosine deaminase n=1 Tax=Thalassovita aquimarina TaxID=2785917 RepID=A0ABS5HW31_9RHOB|nr:adenosine deaminase [Thalassovita aquimarina]MBR9653135.1 adenosine deaminase [Thalassovita aquimarina]